MLWQFPFSPPTSGVKMVRAVEAAAHEALHVPTKPLSTSQTLSSNKHSEGKGLGGRVVNCSHCYVSCTSQALGMAIPVALGLQDAPGCEEDKAVQHQGPHLQSHPCAEQWLPRSPTLSKVAGNSNRSHFGSCFSNTPSPAGLHCVFWQWERFPLRPVQWLGMCVYRAPEVCLVQLRS